MVVFRPLGFISFCGLIAAMLPACGGGQGTTVVPNSSQSSTTVHKSTASYGVGLNDYLNLYSGPGRRSQWTHYYCQSPGYVYPNCPTIGANKNGAQYATTHQVSSYRGSASLGVADASKLGAATFSQSDSVTSIPVSGHAEFVGADQTTYYTWEDQLTPTSNTLPYGTPASFKVTLTVTPTTTNPFCNAFGGESSVYFQAPGIDSSNDGVGVYGYCHDVGSYTNGTFEYTVGGVSGPQGTKDVGTLSGNIGEPMPILGDGALSTGASNQCGLGGVFCLGTFSDALAGSVKVTIKPITPGVSFTTASGKRY